MVASLLASPSEERRPGPTAYLHRSLSPRQRQEPGPSGPGFLVYARHGQQPGGASPLQEAVVPTASRRQRRHREVGSEGSSRQSSDPRNTNRIRGWATRMSRHDTVMSDTTKGLSDRCGGAGAKAAVLIRGDLPGLSRLRLLRGRREDQSQARAEDETSSPSSVTRTHRPQPLDRHAHAARAAQPVSCRMDGALRAGRDALGLRRGRRVAPAQAAPGSLRRSGSGLPRGAATCEPSASPTGRPANGQPAGRAAGGSRGPPRSNAPCPTATGSISAWCPSATASVAFGSTGEPPDADPHVRWCGRGRCDAAPSPIPWVRGSGGRGSRRRRRRGRPPRNPR